MGDGDSTQGLCWSNGLCRFEETELTELDGSEKERDVDAKIRTCQVGDRQLQSEGSA
jgi:hypothetical protein